MKKKITREAVEFQPDAIEITNEKMPWLARWSILFLLLFFAGILTWAIVSEVDVVVTANGKLVTDQQTIVMKPLERVVISKVHVNIGDVVEPDQVLFSFDPTSNIAESARLRHELDVLQSEYDRLEAEFLGKPYVASEERSDKIQGAIFDQRRNYYQEKIRFYDEELNQLDASRKSREDSLRKQRERLEKVMEIEEMYVTLREKNATSTKELLSTQISRMEMEATVDELENSLLELTHQRASTLASKQGFIQEWRNSISESLVETERNLSSTRRQLEKNEYLVDYVSLRAPCRAVVHEIAAFSSGSAVREAESLITLIPLDGELELEAEIRPQDIGKVEIGSEVRIKLNAYPFQKHGTLEGKVRNISSNTLIRQGNPQQPDQSGSYYRARIVISGQLDNVKDNFQLIPGMECVAEIKTGKRRIIEYLIYPLIKSLDEAAREP